MNTDKWIVEDGLWVCPICTAHTNNIKDHKCPEWMKMLFYMKK